MNECLSGVETVSRRESDLDTGQCLIVALHHLRIPIHLGKARSRMVFVHSLAPSSTTPSPKLWSSSSTGTAAWTPRRRSNGREPHTVPTVCTAITRLATDTIVDQLCLDLSYRSPLLSSESC